MIKKKKHYHHKNLRATLLTLTAKIIAEEGLGKVTLRELAWRLNISRTAPYRHFKDKNTLLAAVAEEKFQALNLSLLSAFEAGDPLAQLRRIALSYMAFAIDNYELYRLMFSEEFKNGELYPGLAEAGDETFAVIAQTVLTCRESGLFKQQDPNWMTYSFWATLHGMVELYMEDKLPAVRDKDAFFEFVFQTLVTGLVEPKVASDLDSFGAPPPGL